VVLVPALYANMDQFDRNYQRKPVVPRMEKYNDWNWSLYIAVGDLVRGLLEGFVEGMVRGCGSFRWTDIIQIEIKSSSPTAASVCPISSLLLLILKPISL
jgi:hypothetical protein